VVEVHRDAEARTVRPLPRSLAAVARRLVDEASLIEKLVAIENLLLVPGRALERETNAYALLAADRLRRRAALGGDPFAELRLDGRFEDLRAPAPPILPWEIVIPAAP